KFGIPEWQEKGTLQFNRGIYPTGLSRSEKFPEGESADDAAREGKNHVHVAVVSHGIYIKEAIRALAKYDRTADITACDYQWLRNTAWASRRGGIGREAYDARQKDIRGFFGAKSEGRRSRGL
ncbi:hypothetical protein B0H19DRAFT_1107795, partial [Mycena capillaripes]